MVDPEENEFIERACQFEQQLRQQCSHRRETSPADAPELAELDDNVTRLIRSVGDVGSTSIDPSAAPSLDDPYELKMAKKALLFLNEVRDAATTVANLTDQARHDGGSTANESNATQNPYSAPPLPSRLGRYVILSLIGQGGFADVYLARDPTLDRLTALKIPRPQLLAADTSRRRFEREARAAATLGHPQIVPVFEFGELGNLIDNHSLQSQGLSYIAFEYVPGTTLSEWLSKGETTIAADESAAIVGRLAEVIEHAHQRGVVHRDLKPSNILIDSRNAEQTTLADQLRIADFGLAKHDARDDSLLTIKGMAIGTPAYMSPEQAQGSMEVGFATDIYALGMILYELLTKQLPFKRDGQLATLQAVTSEPARSVRHLRPDVCRGLDAICMKCLSKKPELRYASAFALSEDLRAWREGRPILARQSTALQKLFQWSKRNPQLAGALLTTLASLSIGLGLTVWKYREAAEHLATANQQRDRAERHLEHIEKVADDILGELAFDLRTAPHMDSVRREVMQKALALQTALTDEEPDSDLVRARTIKALLRTTELMRQMGDATQSREAISRALKLAIEVGPKSKQYAETQYLVAELNNHRARLALDQRDYSAAREILEDSRNVIASLDLANMSTGRVPLLAELHRLLGMAYEGEGAFELAEGAYREGIDSSPEVVAAHPTEATYLKALLANSLAVLYNRTGRSELAFQTYMQASDLLSNLKAEFPQRLDFIGLAATVAFNIGNYHSRAQDWQKSEEYFRTAHESFAVLRLASPDDVLHRRTEAEVTGMLASSLAHLKRFEEAKELFAQTLALISDYPDPGLVRDLQLRHSNNYARMLADDLGDVDAAREIFLNVVRSVDSSSGASDEWQIWKSLAFAYKNLGEIDERARDADPTAARVWFEQQLAFSERVLNQNPSDRKSQNDVAFAHAKIVGTYLSEQSYDLARKQADQIASILPDIADLSYRAAREHAKIYLRIQSEDTAAVDLDELQASLLKVEQHLHAARDQHHERLGELLEKDPIWKSMSEHEQFSTWLNEVRNHTPALPDTL